MWLLLLYWWALQYPVTDAAEETKVEDNTAVAVDQWMREVCSTKLLCLPCNPARGRWGGLSGGRIPIPPQT